MDFDHYQFIAAADARTRIEGMPPYSALLSVVQGFLEVFGPSVDADKPLRGCDAVDGVVDSVDSLRRALQS